MRFRPMMPHSRVPRPRALWAGVYFCFSGSRARANDGRQCDVCQPQVCSESTELGGNMGPVRIVGTQIGVVMVRYGKLAIIRRARRN